MRKNEMVDVIIENVESVNASILKVYGVSCGVGYDLFVTVKTKKTQILGFNAHAVRQSWACVGYLRPNNPYYRYTGSNDVYQSRVIEYWRNGGGFREFLGRMSKDALQVIFNEITA
jgi:hypothetical protein